MESQERTTPHSTAQQSPPSYSKWRRIRVFDRPESSDSRGPSVGTTVMVVLGLIVLIVLGIIIF